MTQDASTDNHRITIEACAERVGVPHTTLRKALKSGDCVGVNFGSRIGWRVSPLEGCAWLRNLELLHAGKIAALDLERVAGRLRAIGLEAVANAVADLEAHEAKAAAESEDVAAAAA